MTLMTMTVHGMVRVNDYGGGDDDGSDTVMIMMMVWIVSMSWRQWW